MGQYGQHSVLKCMVQTTDKDTSIRLVTWRKIGVKKALLVFHEEETTSLTGYGFDQQSWNDKNMDVSLRIASTKVADAGGYKCTVVTDSGEGSGEVNLKVIGEWI